MLPALRLLASSVDLNQACMMRIYHRGTEDTEEPSYRSTYAIVGAAIAVHRRLGPGLLESAYEACLSRELSLRGIPFHRQVPLPMEYRGLQLDCGYRLDLVVNGSIIIEVKALSKVLPIHRAQVLTYLKLTECRLGFLINFNVEVLRSGIYRSSTDDASSVSFVPLW
jgi:GxxExxY protein